MYGNVPVKSMNIHHFEMDTNDATLISSDLQAGVTAYARGQKVTGTGKSFEFASYSALQTNQPLYIPSNINVVEIASVNYPIQLTIMFSEMKNVDFTVEQIIGKVIVDGTTYDVLVSATNNSLLFTCDKTITLEVFFGKDNYV